MKKGMIFFAAVLTLLVSCKKDDGALADSSTLSVYFQAGEQVESKAGLQYQLFANIEGEKMLVSDNQGFMPMIQEYRSLSAGTYEVEAIWNDTLLNGTVDVYRADTTIVLMKNANVPVTLNLEK